MEENRPVVYRILVLVLFFVCVMSVMAARLIDLQLVHGADYAEQSERRLLRSFTVKASRGELLDRYGRPLVTNRQVFQVIFEYAYWDRENQNEILLNLCRLMNEQGAEYVDTLPVTHAAPYAFTEGAEAADRKRLANFLRDEMELSADISAEAAIEALAGRYKADENLSLSEKRAIAGVRYEMERRSFSSYNTFTFAENIEMETVSRIKENHLAFPGVEIEAAPIREYRTDYGAHIIGRVGLIYKEEYEELKAKGYPMDATVGKDGMEKALEDWLRGVSGVRAVETNVAGKVTDEIFTKAPSPGNNCVLTIDIALQEVAERSLEQNILRIKAAGEAGIKSGSADIEGGAAVVIDVNTGEILALANYPTYRLSTFNKDYAALAADEMTPMVNRAIAGVYPPGSTFKMVTALAGLEEDVITTKTRITDTGVYMYYAPNYTPRCWYYADYGRGHGTLDVVGALKNSCNYFFYETGRLLGIERLNHYSTVLGLGRKTGIELAGESAGILAGPANREATKGPEWQPGETIQAAIGQANNSFTPIQLAAYVATLVNGGTYYRPHLLKTVQSYDYSGIVYEEQPEAVYKVEIRPENYKAVMEGMRSVTEDGTASNVFHDYAMSVGGKTGSAQAIAGRSAHGVFVAFAPFDKPEIAVCVVGEHAGSGNQMAWVARDLFDAYFGAKGSMMEAPEENVLLR